MMQLCTKPCLQTCWARPEADSLSEIIDTFLQGITQENKENKEELKSRLNHAATLLDAYKTIVEKS